MDEIAGPDVQSPITIERTIVTLEADKPFEVELIGPQHPINAVFMVHGFGVSRDSRGMFVDIESQLTPGFLSVRGDFSDVNGNRTRAIPISTQAQRLDQIVRYVVDKYKPAKLTFIGHSQGSLVIAKANPSESEVILLAPPIESPSERFAATPGWTRPGSVLNREGESRLMRSDGSVTEVDQDFWKDFRGIDAEALYSELGKRNNVHIIFAGDDQVLGHQKTLTDIPVDYIGSADHDFKDQARAELIQKISSLIS